jgi:hypothetical protein
MIFCACNLQAQNIIFNHSFEDTIQGNFGIIKAKGWSSPTNGSPDLIDSLSRPEYHMPQNYMGYQLAQDSNRYYGIVVFSKDRNNAREYIQSQLIKSLEKDSTYCFQLFISLADSTNYAIKNNLGVYFSTQIIQDQGVGRLNYIPQIEFIDEEYFLEKVNWVKYTAQFIATGDEKFITIGNFNDDANIDTINIGSIGKQLWHDATYYYIDDIYLGHCDSIIGLPEISLNQQVNVYPNPTNDQLFISYEGKEKLQLKLYNLVGQALEIEQQQNVKNIQISLNHLSKGVYFLEIIAGEQRISRKIIKR